jgi:ABC-2 type transport system permease protein
VATLARNLLSVLIIVGVGLLVGFRPTAGVWEWGAVLGLAMLFSLALAWLAAIIGLLVKSVEAASGFTFVFIFLPYLSSAFVPTQHMPTILRVVAENQPITPVIETLRALTIGGSLGNYGWLAVGWCISIGLISYVVAVALFKRKTSH